MGAKKKDKEKAQEIWELALNYYNDHDYARVLPLLDRIDQIANKAVVDDLIMMRAYNTRGLIASTLSDFKNAEKYYLQSLEYAKKMGDPIFIANRYDNLASIYPSLNQPKTAIEYLELSLQTKEQSGNEKNLHITLLSLAGLYLDIGDPQAAERSLSESLYYIKKFNHSNVYHYYYFNLAVLRQEEKNWKKAVTSYDSCVKYALEYKDYNTAAKAYANQGKSYMEIKEWRKAEYKYSIAITIARENNLRPVDLLASTHLGLIAVEKGDLKRGHELYEYVNEHILPEDIDFLHGDFAELKSLLHEAEGQYQPALESYKTYLGYYKKQYDNDMKRSVQNLQAKYDAEKKDRALEKSKLLQAQSELKALRAQMDPHFIFNALSSLRKEMLQGNLEVADTYLVRFSKLLRLILDTTRTPNIRLSDNIELLHLYIQIEKNRQGNRFDYSITTKGVDSDATHIPGLILQPLAENAIVHGLYNKKNGQGKLTISFSKTKEALVIKVRDNGVGRLAGKDKVKAGHTSHAMSIIRETLDLTWQGSNVKNYFTVKDLMTKDNVNIGTEVTVLLPLS